MEEGAKEEGVSVADLLRTTDRVIHGSTIATNALVERKGGKVGLLTTRGFEGTLHVGRIIQKNAGLSEREIIHVSRAKKPAPLVERRMIYGVAERIDADGEVVAPLDLEDAMEGAGRLVDAGAEALAVCFLWSFLNPAHEKTVERKLRALYPDVFVLASYEAAPVLGEYERMVTTVLNGYVAGKVSDYVGRFEGALKANGFRGTMLLMQCTGGVSGVDEIRRHPITMLDSGPVGGILGAKQIGKSNRDPNLICTDVGGTSFDVGLIRNGAWEIEDFPVLEQFTFRVPKVLVKSIGSGGGSIIWLDDMGILRVGPESAGADPGPACYGKGGTRPTLTDADLLLGYLNPDYFLGGRIPLDVALAAESLKGIARSTGMDPVKICSAAFDISNAQMADLIRKSTIEKGYDPREFVLLAYGGAGPTHAAFYGRDAGVQEIIIPSHSAVFSAYGLLNADIVHIQEQSVPLRLPPRDVSIPKADLSALNRATQGLRAAVLARFRGEKANGRPPKLETVLKMRYQMQVHEISVPVKPERLKAGDNRALIRDFEKEYAKAYGEGTGFQNAGVEVTTACVVGTAKMARPRVSRKKSPAAGRKIKAFKGKRRLFFRNEGKFITGEIFDGILLAGGEKLAGPSIIERPRDTVLIPPGARGYVDEQLNIRIRWER